MLASRQSFLDEIGLSEDGKGNNYCFDVWAFKQFGVWFVGARIFGVEVGGGWLDFFGELLGWGQAAGVDGLERELVSVGFDTRLSCHVRA
jgi:hypothetical protein